MSQIIASTYEIIRQLGAGGGGVVYLARHLRLGKWVVLKADKRTVKTPPEVLRREVDALKNLSHSYIPQVYDFIVEDDVAYTVMDYIEGESLDKPLQRGERFSQAQLLQWLRQLLEALSYLHNRPPHGLLHGDIKPANIMVTPEGDIRLIDFNIALALGEEGAVQVGYSLGYASPEHYGSSFPPSSHTAATATRTMASPSGPIDPRCATEIMDPQSGSHRMVLLSARSDIYSLGATFYHLFSGKRPSRHAQQVTPLTEECCSKEVSAILAKAMHPDPALRYQTADEMLLALDGLYDNDARTIRLRRRRNVTAALLVTAFLVGAGMTFGGLRIMERVQAAAAQTAQQGKMREQAAKEALADIREAEDAYTQGDLAVARTLARKAMWEGCPYYAQAQKVLTDALGVYDLSDGLKAHCLAELPSESLKIAISPQGDKFAALYAYQVAVFDSDTGECLATLPTRPSALSDLIFISEEVLLYAGENGLTAYNVTTGQELWQGEPITRLTVSQDGKRAAGVLDKEGQAFIYSTTDGALYKTISFRGHSQSIPADGGVLADPEDALLALNADGSMLAASFEGGGLYLYNVETGEDYAIMDSSDYTHIEGGFYQNYFAFSAWNTDECIFLIYDTADLVQVGGFQAQVPFLVQTDPQGICVASGNLLVEIDPTTGDQKELAYASADITGYSRGADGSVLVATGSGDYALFNSAAQLVAQGTREAGGEFLATAGPYVILASRETANVQVLKLENYPEAQLCAYPPGFSHAEARVSDDGTRVMLFQYDHFALFTSQGEELCQVEIPEPMEVYDQQFRRDESGSRLEVTYRDGRISAYSAQDGSLLWEKQGETPKGDLSETFETSRWRIESSPHGAPRVYDKETGQLERELEQDSYLTYVTEVEDYLVTQYLSANGEYYGLLLNQDFETLAYLPDLCDVANGTLVFDDNLGNLRQSRIYSPQELLDLADT